MLVVELLPQILTIAGYNDYRQCLWQKHTCTGVAKFLVVNFYIPQCTGIISPIYQHQFLCYTDRTYCSYSSVLIMLHSYHNSLIWEGFTIKSCYDFTLARRSNRFQSVDTLDMWSWRATMNHSSRCVSLRNKKMKVNQNIWQAETCFTHLNESSKFVVNVIGKIWFPWNDFTFSLFLSIFITRYGKLSKPSKHTVITIMLYHACLISWCTLEGASCVRFEKMFFFSSYKGRLSMDLLNMQIRSVTPKGLDIIY